MQIPLEEFTNNTIETNLVVNWFLRSISLVGSLTIGHHQNIQCEGRRGIFCENWGRQAYWSMREARMKGRRGRTQKENMGLCQGQSPNSLWIFQGLELPKTASLILSLYLPVNSLRTEIQSLGRPSHKEKGWSPLPGSGISSFAPSFGRFESTPFSLLAF